MNSHTFTHELTLAHTLTQSLTGSQSLPDTRSLLRMAARRGVRGDALSLLSGVPDCVFVHSAGFIGGTKTLPSAMLMAEKALRYDDATPDTKRAKTA